MLALRHVLRLPSPVGTGGYRESQIPVRVAVQVQGAFMVLSLRRLVLFPYRVLVGQFRHYLTIALSILFGVALKTLYDRFATPLPTQQLRRAPSPSSPPSSPFAESSCSTPPSSPRPRQPSDIELHRQASDLRKGRAPSSPERREFDQEWAAARSRFAHSWSHQ